jgi:large subunit ribosomal protein L10
MNRDEKSAAIEEIAAQIEGAEAIFAVDYRGITVSQAADLRGRLRESDASFRVVKNRLTKLAADKAGEDRLTDLLEGPTALTFVHGDTAGAAKAISTFNREHKVLAFKGGFMDGLTLDEETFKSIARLPSRQVLDGQLAGIVASPLTGLVRGLGSMISGLALQLGQIAEKGLVSGEAPAAAPPAEDGEDTSEEPSKSDDSGPSEEAPETEQGDADPPAAEAEPSTPAESDGDASPETSEDEGDEAPAEDAVPADEGSAGETKAEEADDEAAEDADASDDPETSKQEEDDE